MIAVLVVLFSLFTAPAYASIIIYENDFSSTDLSDWTLSGPAQTWQVVGGELVTSRAPAGFRYFGLNSISTPESLRFMVDVRNIAGSSDRPTSFGHGGLFWDQTAPGTENLTYIRTHSNHLNLYSIGAGETHAPIVADNGDTIRYTVDVNYLTKELSIQALLIAGVNAGNSTQINYTGAAFDTYVRAFAGGSVGLFAWGDAVAFDNVKIYDTTVSEPWTVSMLGLVLFGMLLKRRKHA